MSIMTTNNQTASLTGCTNAGTGVFVEGNHHIFPEDDRLTIAKMPSMNKSLNVSSATHLKLDEQKLATTHLKLEPHPNVSAEKHSCKLRKHRYGTKFCTECSIQFTTNWIGHYEAYYWETPCGIWRRIAPHLAFEDEWITVKRGITKIVPPVCWTCYKAVERHWNLIVEKHGGPVVLLRSGDIEMNPGPYWPAFIVSIPSAPKKPPPKDITVDGDVEKNPGPNVKGFVYCMLRHGLVVCSECLDIVSDARFLTQEQCHPDFALVYFGTPDPYIGVDEDIDYILNDIDAYWSYTPGKIGKHLLADTEVWEMETELFDNYYQWLPNELRLRKKCIHKFLQAAATRWGGNRMFMWYSAFEKWNCPEIIVWWTTEIFNAKKHAFIYRLVEDVQKLCRFLTTFREEATSRQLLLAYMHELNFDYDISEHTPMPVQRKQISLSQIINMSNRSERNRICKEKYGMNFNQVIDCIYNYWCSKWVPEDMLDHEDILLSGDIETNPGPFDEQDWVFGNIYKTLEDSHFDRLNDRSAFCLHFVKGGDIKDLCYDCEKPCDGNHSFLWFLLRINAIFDEVTKDERPKEDATKIPDNESQGHYERAQKTKDKDRAVVANVLDQFQLKISEAEFEILLELYKLQTFYCPIFGKITKRWCHPCHKNRLAMLRYTVIAIKEGKINLINCRDQSEPTSSKSEEFFQMPEKKRSHPQSRRRSNRSFSLFETQKDELPPKWSFLNKYWANLELSDDIGCGVGLSYEILPFWKIREETDCEEYKLLVVGWAEFSFFKAHPIPTIKPNSFDKEDIDFRKGLEARLEDVQFVLGPAPYSNKMGFFFNELWLPEHYEALKTAGYYPKYIHQEFCFYEYDPTGAWNYLEPRFSLRMVPKTTLAGWLWKVDQLDEIVVLVDLDAPSLFLESVQISDGSYSTAARKMRALTSSYLQYWSMIIDGTVLYQGYRAARLNERQMVSAHCTHEAIQFLRGFISNSRILDGFHSVLKHEDIRGSFSHALDPFANEDKPRDPDHEDTLPERRERYTTYFRMAKDLIASYFLGQEEAENDIFNIDGNPFEEESFARHQSGDVSADNDDMKEEVHLKLEEIPNVSSDFGGKPEPHLKLNESLNVSSEEEAGKFEIIDDELDTGVQGLVRRVPDLFNHVHQAFEDSFKDGPLNTQGGQQPRDIEEVRSFGEIFEEVQSIVRKEIEESVVLYSAPNIPVRVVEESLKEEPVIALYQEALCRWFSDFENQTVYFIRGQFETLIAIWRDMLVWVRQNTDDIRHDFQRCLERNFGIFEDILLLSQEELFSEGEHWIARTQERCSRLTVHIFRQFQYLLNTLTFDFFNPFGDFLQRVAKIFSNDPEFAIWGASGCALLSRLSDDQTNCIKSNLLIEREHIKGLRGSEEEWNLSSTRHFVTLRSRYMNGINQHNVGDDLLINCPIITQMDTTVQIDDQTFNIYEPPPYNPRRLKINVFHEADHFSFVRPECIYWAFLFKLYTPSPHASFWTTVYRCGKTPPLYDLFEQAQFHEFADKFLKQMTSGMCVEWRSQDWETLTPEILVETMRNMPPKQAQSRMDAYWQAFNAEVKPDSHHSIAFVKQDENPGGGKPRHIFNSSHYAFQTLQPGLFDIKKSLKQESPVWYFGQEIMMPTPHVFKTAGLTFKVSYMADTDQVQDAAWMFFAMQAQPGEVHIAVGGDDNTTIMNIGGVIYQIEGDISMCDQSMNEGLSGLFIAFCRLAGASEQFLKVLQESYTMPCLFFSRPDIHTNPELIAVVHFLVWMLKTGWPQTSCSNTVLLMLIVSYVINKTTYAPRNRGQEMDSTWLSEHLKNNFALLGIKMKIAVYKGHYCMVTYHKKYFIEHPSGIYTTSFLPGASIPRMLRVRTSTPINSSVFWQRIREGISSRLPVVAHPKLRRWMCSLAEELIWQPGDLLYKGISNVNVGSQFMDDESIPLHEEFWCRRYRITRDNVRLIVDFICTLREGYFYDTRCFPEVNCLLTQMWIIDNS